MMKHRFIRTVCATMIATQLVACASTKVQIESAPDDAKIYVDGVPQGKGLASVDVGAEYGYPRALAVTIKKDGYETLEKRIDAEPDWGLTGINATILLAVGLLVGISGISSNNTVTMTLGALDLLLIPFTFFNNNKYRKAYSFELHRTH